jgi:hypothetical protein
MRRSSRANLADMLVKLGLERLHQLLKILQRSGGFGTSIRGGGAEVAGLIEARVRAIRATKVLTRRGTIVTAKVGTKRGTRIVARVTAIWAGISTASVLTGEECDFRRIELHNSIRSRIKGIS